MRKILILEPYFGGSHKNFLEGLMGNVVAEYTIFTLPARKWKMRMQLSAQWFVEQLQQLPVEERKFDTVLCSTFIDVAVFRALVSKLDGWGTDTKFCLYFHENQFAYPNRTKDTSLYHFTSINFNSAMSADAIAFNSDFNRQSFFDGCKRYLKFASDMKFGNIIGDLENKSSVIYPGVEFSTIDSVRCKAKSLDPVILWNHRWEHDKNPEEFFNALEVLKNKNIPFGLIIIGQAFRQSPECFKRARSIFQDEIIHFGFVESYSDYIKQLAKATIVASTSIHEFYGISVIEAVRAGCQPLLPNRLSYPELFPKEYLYEEGCFEKKLEQLVMENRQVKEDTALQLTEKFSWTTLAAHYDEWLLA